MEQYEVYYEDDSVDPGLFLMWWSGWNSWLLFRHPLSREVFSCRMYENPRIARAKLYHRYNFCASRSVLLWTEWAVTNGSFIQGEVTGFVCILKENEYNRDMRNYRMTMYHYAKERDRLMYPLWGYYYAKNMTELMYPLRGYHYAKENGWTKVRRV